MKLTHQNHQQSSKIVLDNHEDMLYNNSMFLSSLEELIHDSEMFYDLLMEIGTKPCMVDIRKTENFISGCQSQVWIAVVNNRIVVDADAIMVRGIARVISDYAKQHDDIKFSDFHKITKPLTMQRQRGMQAIINRIRVLKSAIKSQ